MLTKLIKYEWKATARYLLPLYLVLAIMTVFTRIFFTIEVLHDPLSISMSIVLFLYFISLIALCVTTFLIIIMRFYKNLLTGEGYLMFTLPVTVGNLIKSKLVLSVFWAIICIFMSFASLLIVLPGASKLDPAFSSFTLRNISDSLGNFKTFSIVIVAITILAGLIMNILNFYTSIALGQMIAKNKVMGSVIAYIGLYMVFQFIGLIFLLACYLVGVDENNTDLVFRLIVGYGLSIFTAGGIILYATTKHVLMKRLNLE